MNQENNTRKLSRMGRRRFLKNLSKVGIGAATLGYITQDSLAEKVDDINDKVPIVKEVVNSHPEAVEKDRGRDGRVPIYDYVERDKWDRHIARQRTQDALLHVLEMKGHHDVSVGATTETMRNRDSAIQITAGDRKELEILKEKAPKEIDILGPNGKGVLETVPIHFEKIDSVKDHKDCEPSSNGCHYDEKYRPLPGGCKISMFDNDPVFDERFYGTSTTPAKHNSTGKDVLVTAGHNLRVEGDNDDPTSPHPVSAIDQPDKGDEIAGKNDLEYHVDSYYFDAGYIKTDKDIRYNLADENGGYGPKIQGIVDESYMKFMVDEGDTDRTQMDLKGQTIWTGRSNANVSNVFNYQEKSGSNGCDKFTFFQYRSGDWRPQDGASGSPIFNETSSGVTIAGIHKGNYNGNDNNDVFVSMTDVECYFDLTVNPRGETCNYERYVNYYDSNDDCSISTSELNDATSDWAENKISTSVLRNVIDAWASS